MFYSNEHYMSILHMAIFVYMATQHRHIWCQNLGISFMIWFSIGLPWFHEDDQRSGSEQGGIYFGAACSGDRRRERENTRPQKIRNKEKRPKTRRTNSAPPRKKKENVQHQKKKNSATPKEKKKRKAWKEKKKKKVTQLNFKKKKGMKKRKRIWRYLLIYVCHSLIYE